MSIKKVSKVQPDLFEYTNENLENAAKRKQLYAYTHKGFWICMDTSRDKDVLEKLFKKNKLSY